MSIIKSLNAFLVVTSIYALMKLALCNIAKNERPKSKYTNIRTKVSKKKINYQFKILNLTEFFNCRGHFANYQSIKRDIAHFLS